MNNSVKCIFRIFLIGSILPFNIFAQVLPTVQKSFNQAVSNTLQEKLFVHTDKNSYTTGELMWFKIYNVDGINHRPVDFSKVVYVEVLNNSQNAVLQAKIIMKNGSGSGSLYLPVNLSSGNYLLRAYTNWMKNFSPDYYFNKQLTVINPLKSPDKQLVSAAPEYDIQFFPEGGSLVNNITSIIAFKVTDQWGKGVNFKGIIVNKQNDTLVRFKPLKFGMGHFNFKPDNTNNYHAVIEIAGKKIIKELPLITNNGYVMNVKNNGSDKLLITVNTNQPPGNIYLFAHTRNVITIVEAALTENGTAHFNIDKSKLGDGITHLTIFNNNKRPVCERLYFKLPRKNLLIDATTEHQQYTFRKKVIVNIDAKNGNGDPVAADLSMSVYRIDSLQHPHQEDIQSYLWLTSDLKGNIESPEYYFQNVNAETEEAVDNLMLTQGWSRFNWNNILTGKAPMFKFLPEHNGPIIAAQITNLLTGTPARDIIAYLAIPGKRVQMYTAASDTLGHLLFNMKEFYGPGEIVIQTNTEVDTIYKIEVQNPFSEQYMKRILPPLLITPDMEPIFENQSLGMQVQNIYNGLKTRRFYEPDVDSSAFYGPPFKTYLLDNYTRFSTIEEVLREYVSEVNVKISKNKYYIIVHNGIDYLNEENPMVMLDGVPFFNMNKVFAFDPLKIRKLEDIPFSYYYGQSNEEGILSFSTYKGDLGGTEIDPHAVVLDYEGMELNREFYSPEYDTEKALLSRIPDYRNVLYWAPYITTSVQGKKGIDFYTSDQTGKYIGVLQGLTVNGELGSQYFMFDITK